MSCKYSKRESECDSSGWYRLYCNIVNDICPFQYRCYKISNWKNQDNLDKKCIYYKNEEDKSYMAQGKYKVLYEKRGMLYIELDHDTSIRVSNPFNIIPSGVDLIKIKDEYYIKGYEPKVEVEPKMVTSTNKKNKIKD